ncbi:hypothetical protein Hanom_Chr01g00090071 [Helianthus anomalus]
MERALNGTKMGGHKLIANLASFAKENASFDGGKKEGGRGKEKTQERPAQKNPTTTSAPSFQIGNGRLFSDLFTNKSTTPADLGKSVKTAEVFIEIADETSAFKDLIGNALVGRCKDLPILKNLNKFADEELCSKFLLDYQTWKDWFRSLDPWECQPLPFERIVWVRVSGVPMHLADNDVINNIAEHIGKIVHGSKMEAGDDNLSATWIGLLVREGERIHGVVNLKWRDKEFRIWLDEEIIDWAPDSVGEVIGMNDDDEDLPSENFEYADDILDQEIPVASPEIRHAVEEVQRFESVNVIEDVERCHNSIVGSGDNVSASKNVGEPPMQSCGSQGDKDGSPREKSDPLFFISASHCVRPKKRNPVLRPRSKTQNQHGRSSPSSSERPNKRARDDGDFLLDLNMDPLLQAQGVHLVDCDIQRQSLPECSPNPSNIKKRTEIEEIKSHDEDNGSKSDRKP